MTIKEVAFKYANYTGKENTIGTLIASSKIIGFIDGVKYADKWISVKEYLPELSHFKDIDNVHKQILVKDENGSCSVVGIYAEKDILHLRANYPYWRYINHK